MVRNLRIVAASFCLVASLALAALWVHSYAHRDALLGPAVVIQSWWGQISVRWAEKMEERNRWGRISGSTEGFEELIFQLSDDEQAWPPRPSLLGFTGKINFQGDFCVAFPHWFPLILAIAFSVIMKPQPRLRFSLWEVLVLATVLALAMGGGLAMIRGTSS